MSEDKSNDWDRLWKEYSQALEKWQEVFSSMQKASLEMQKKYNEAMEKAASESSQDTMKQFGENWQKAMNDYSVGSFKEFGEKWQKAMNESTLEPMKAYGDMMNKFAETWKKMWQN